MLCEELEMVAAQRMRRTLFYSLRSVVTKTCSNGHRDKVGPGFSGSGQILRKTLGLFQAENHAGK